MASSREQDDLCSLLLMLTGWVNTLVGGQWSGARGFMFFIINVDKLGFVCLFVLRLNVPVATIFQSCLDRDTASWVINQYFRGVKCLAQGHNTAVVGFEPRTSRSRVRHSTTEPPRSPDKLGNHSGGWPVVRSERIHVLCC